MKLFGSSDKKKQIKKVTNSSNELVGLTSSNYSFNFFGPYTNKSVKTKLEENRTATNFGIPFKKRLVTSTNDILVFSQPSGRSNCWATYSGENIDIEFKINPVNVHYGSTTTQVNTNSSPIVGFSKYNRAKASTWNNAYLDFSVMFNNGQCFAKDKNDTEMLVNGINIVAGNEYTVKFSINNAVVLLFINGDLVKRFANKAYGMYTPMFSSSHTASTSVLENGQNILINPRVSYSNKLPVALDSFNISNQVVQVGTSLTEEQKENCSKTDVITYEDSNFNEESSGNALTTSPRNKELGYNSNGLLGLISEFPTAVSATIDLSNIKEVADLNVLDSYGEFSLYDKDSNKIAVFVVRQKLEDSYSNALKKFYLYGLDSDYYIYQIKNEGLDHYEYTTYTYPYITEDGEKYLAPGNYSQITTSGSYVMFVNSLSFPVQREYPYQPSDLQGKIQSAIDLYNSAKLYATNNNLSQLESNYLSAQSAYNTAYNNLNTADGNVDSAYSTLQTRYNSWVSSINSLSNATSTANNNLGSAYSYFNSFWSQINSKITIGINATPSLGNTNYVTQYSGLGGTMRNTTSAQTMLSYSYSPTSASDRYWQACINIFSRTNNGSTPYSPSLDFGDSVAYSNAMNSAQNYYNSKTALNSAISTESSNYSSYVSQITTYNNAVTAYNNALSAYNTANSNYETAANAYWPIRNNYDNAMASARSQSNIVINYYDEMSEVSKYNNYDRFITKRITPFYNVETKDGDNLSFLCLNNMVFPNLNGTTIRSTAISKVASHAILMVNKDFNFTNLKAQPALFSSTSQFKIDSQVFDNTRFNIDRNINKIIKTAGLNYTYKIINQTPMASNHISFFVDDISKEYFLSFANYSDTITNQTTRKIDSSNYGMQIRFYQGSIQQWNYQTTSRRTLYSTLQNGDKVDLIVWLRYSTNLTKYYQYQLFVNSILAFTFTSTETNTNVTNGFFMSGLCLYSDTSSVSNYSNIAIDIDGSRIEKNKIELSKNPKQGGLSLTTILGNEIDYFGNNIYSDSMSGTSHQKVKENKWMPLSTVSGSWTSYGGLTTFQIVDKDDISTASTVFLMDKIKSLELWGKTDSINSQFNIGLLTATSYSGPNSFYRSISSEVSNTNRNAVEKIGTTSAHSFSTPMKARYIRHSVAGNTINNHVHITQLDVRGKINNIDCSVSCPAANPNVVISTYDGTGTALNPTTTFGFYKNLVDSGQTTNSTNAMNAAKRSMIDRLKITQMEIIPQSLSQMTTSILRLVMDSRVNQMPAGTNYFCHFKSKVRISAFDFNDVYINKAGVSYTENTGESYFSEKINSGESFPYEYFISINITTFMVSGTPTRPYAYNTMRFIDIQGENNLTPSDILTTDFQSYCSNPSGVTKYTGFEVEGLKRIQIDLGKIFDISSIDIVHYYNDSRTYYENRTQVSLDGINWIDVHNYQFEGNPVEVYGGFIINTTRGWNIGDSLGVRLERKPNNSFKTRYFVDTYYGRNYYESSLGDIPNNVQYLVPTIALNNKDHYVLNPEYKIEYIDE